MSDCNLLVALVMLGTLAAAVIFCWVANEAHEDAWRQSRVEERLTTAH